MLKKFLSYFFATTLGWLAGGIVGIPLGALSRWSTKRFWLLWIVAIFFVSPVSIRLLKSANIDGRFAVPGYVFISSRLDRCTPTTDAFFEDIKDPQKLREFVEANRWKKSCMNDNSFRLLEVVDLISRQKLDQALPMLGQLLKENPDDKVLLEFSRSLEAKGIKIPK